VRITCDCDRVRMNPTFGLTKLASSIFSFYGSGTVLQVAPWSFEMRSALVP